MSIVGFGERCSADKSENPTEKEPENRRKLDAKPPVLSDTNGIPPPVMLSGANAYDSKCFHATLNGVIVPRRSVSHRVYMSHIKSRGKEENKWNRNRRSEDWHWTVE